MKKLLIAEFEVGLVFSVLFLLFPHAFINAFGAKNESVYYTDFAVKTIRIFLCLLPLSCLNKGTFIFLQSLGKAKQSTALSMMREIIFGVGLPILLPVFLGLDGILYFMPVADIMTAIASIIVIVHTNRVLSAATSGPKPEIPPSGSELGEPPLTDCIITIGRSFGAGGRTIGRQVAQQLHLPYYDAELLEKAAQTSGLSQNFWRVWTKSPWTAACCIALWAF